MILGIRVRARVDGVQEVATRLSQVILDGHHLRTMY